MMAGSIEKRIEALEAKANSRGARWHRHARLTAIALTTKRQ